MSSTTSSQSMAELICCCHITAGDVPPQLIGPSSTIVGDHLYVFGGRLKTTRQISNRLYILSLKTRIWKIVIPDNDQPTPRYFHSASHYDNKIVFFGGMTSGQGQKNQTILNDTFVLKILPHTLEWHYLTAKPSEFGLPQPRYAHNAVITNDQLVIFGGQDIDGSYIAEMNVFDYKRKQWHNPIATQSHYGAYRSSVVASLPPSRTPLLVAEDFVEQFVVMDTEQSTRSTRANIHVFSNHNFNQIQRELDVLTINEQGGLDRQQRQGAALVGDYLPSPLRFPSAFMCGKHLIICGTFLNGEASQFQIWAMDTTLFTWIRLDIDQKLNKGSWLRGELYESTNQFLIFGDHQGSIQDDYRDRVVCFESFFTVDIEAFGVYRPPSTSHDLVSQGLGLAILGNIALADLVLVSTDCERAEVNSSILVQRWSAVHKVLQPFTSPEADDLPDHDKLMLTFPGTGAVMNAFLHYIYTDHLSTAQQHRPDILTQLLIIADMFQMERLKALTSHAMHQKMNRTTARAFYEAAALSGLPALQIRALFILKETNPLEVEDVRQHVRNRRPPSLLLEPNTTSTPKRAGRRQPPVTAHGLSAAMISQGRSPTPRPIESPRSHLKEIIEQSQRQQLNTPRSPQSPRFVAFDQSNTKASSVLPRSPRHIASFESARQLLSFTNNPPASPPSTPTTPSEILIYPNSRQKTFSFWSKKAARSPSPNKMNNDMRSKWIPRTIKF